MKRGKAEKWLEKARLRRAPEYIAARLIVEDAARARAAEKYTLLGPEGKERRKKFISDRRREMKACRQVLIEDLRNLGGRGPVAGCCIIPVHNAKLAHEALKKFEAIEFPCFGSDKFFRPFASNVYGRSSDYIAVEIDDGPSLAGNFAGGNLDHQSMQ